MKIAHSGVIVKPKSLIVSSRETTFIKAVYNATPKSLNTLYKPQLTSRDLAYTSYLSKNRANR